MREFLNGIAYLIRGFRLILRPRIRRFTLIPIFINIAVFSVLIWLGKSWYDSLLQTFLPAGNSWWIEVLYGLLWLLFSVAVILLGFFTFTAVANLIGAPFNSFLAEAVEKQLNPSSNLPETTLSQNIREIPAILLNECRKLGHYLLWIIPAFVLFFIPLLQLLAPFVWFFVIAWMMSLQYLDFPMANHNLKFAEIRQHLRRRRLLFLGFGCAVSVAMMLPILNLFIMPAAVCGATVCWVREYAGPGN